MLLSSDASTSKSKLSTNKEFKMETLLVKSGLDELYNMIKLITLSSNLLQHKFQILQSSTSPK